MRSWLAYWILGRRYGPRDGRLCVRLYWRSPWVPVTLRKVMGPVYLTDEVVARLRELEE